MLWINRQVHCVVFVFFFATIAHANNQLCHTVIYVSVNGTQFNFTMLLSVVSSMSILPVKQFAIPPLCRRENTGVLTVMSPKEKPSGTTTIGGCLIFRIKVLYILKFLCEWCDRHARTKGSASSRWTSFRMSLSQVQPVQLFS